METKTNKNKKHVQKSCLKDSFCREMVEASELTGYDLTRENKPGQVPAMVKQAIWM